MGRGGYRHSLKRLRKRGLASRPFYLELCNWITALCRREHPNFTQFALKYGSRLELPWLYLSLRQSDDNRGLGIKEGLNCQERLIQVLHNLEGGTQSNHALDRTESDSCFPRIS